MTTVLDLYEGRTFDDLDEGLGYARAVGFGEILRRGVAAADDLPADMVYAGFSLGVMPSQSLAQQRAGARGAILCSAAFPTSEFGGAWPQGVPVEIHMMDADPWGEEDRPVAEALVEEARTRSSSCTRGPVICSLMPASATTTSRRPTCCGSAP